MRIVVCVLLYLERLVGSFQLHANRDVECLVLVRQVGVVGILDEASFILLIQSDIDRAAHKVFVEFVEQIEFAGQVYHRACFATLVDELQWRHSCGFGHECVICTECRRDVDYACTVIGRDVVAKDDPECSFAGIDPRQQLFIMHSLEVGAFVFGHDAVGHDLVAFLVGVEVESLAFGVEVGCDEGFGKHGGHRFAGVWIVGLHCHIVNLWPYAECRVGRQCPRRGRPCEEVGVAPSGHLSLGRGDEELCRHRRVLDVAVASGLVELV